MAMREVQTQQTVARINFRLTYEMKEMVERAAIASGQSLTDFAIQTLVARASEVLHHQQVRTLSDRDRDLFLALLDSDEEPNEALKKAAEDYKFYMA
jgi:uncharacterized protein (DUF1778 family)